MKKILLCTLLISLSFAVFAQRTIVGTVTDAESGEPLIGAAITVTGTKEGTLTDIDGAYTLRNIPRIAKSLTFSSVGYTSQTVNLDTSNVVNIKLKSSESIQEVVVIGYSSVKKSVLSGAVQGNSIKSREYKKNKPIRIEPKNTEKYGNTAENAFITTKDDALSTFSIDVDNAAYTNIRRKINEGQKPPQEAVRIEEMINYFDYNIPQPTGNEPVVVNTELADCPWAKGHLLLKMDIQGKKETYKTSPPNNFVFLIDVSGSMQSADKLFLLKNAFKTFVSSLRSNDLVSIVAYAGNAGLVLDATEGSQKEKILKAIESLEAGGSTAGGEGINLAYKIAEEHFFPEGNNRVILATDGDFNVGVSSTAQLERLIENKRHTGIYLSVLGFGTGNINDEGMETLADKGNGNYYYIDSEKEADRVLRQKLVSTILTVANDVKFQVEFNPLKVASYRLVGYENRLLDDVDFNDDKKDAGDLGAGQSVTAFYEIIPTEMASSANTTPKIDPLRYQTQVLTPESRSNEWVFVKMRYKRPTRFKSTLLEKSFEAAPKKWADASEDFRFAASVAAFGQLLRNSAHKGECTYDDIIEWANAAKGDDVEKSEFIDLVKKIKILQ